MLYVPLSTTRTVAVPNGKYFGFMKASSATMNPQVGDYISNVNPDTMMYIEITNGTMTGVYSSITITYNGTNISRNNPSSINNNAFWFCKLD